MHATAHGLNIPWLFCVFLLCIIRFITAHKSCRWMLSDEAESLAFLLHRQPIAWFSIMFWHSSSVTGTLVVLCSLLFYFLLSNGNLHELSIRCVAPRFYTTHSALYLIYWDLKGFLPLYDASWYYGHGCTFSNDVPSSFLFCTTHDIWSIIVRLNFSIMPSELGLFGALLVCIISCCLQKSRNNALWNCFPWSVCTCFMSP